MILQLIHSQSSIFFFFLQRNCFTENAVHFFFIMIKVGSFGGALNKHPLILTRAQN